MSTEQEATSDAHQSWLTTLSEARKNCRLQIGEAAQQVDDPHKALWPPTVNRRNQAHQKLKMAHVSTIDYADQVRPYAIAADEDDREHELWHETIETVELPSADRPVSLATLPKYWESAFEKVAEQQKDELRGQTTSYQQYRLLLPVQIARQCYRQLNEIVVELGFAPEAPGGEQRTEITEELMRDVEEWRQNNLDT